MKVEERGRDLVITEYTDFDIAQTMECGQCFHFERLDDHEYALVAFGHFKHVRQDEKRFVLYDTGKAEYDALWRRYFDFDTDYAAIKEYLLKTDSKLIEAIETMGGVHLLNQEFFETLMSFIISQNKQIPHIKQIVSTISANYGEYLEECGGMEFYSFPGCDVLFEKAGEQSYRDCKAGFRAPYLQDAVERVRLGEVDADRMRQADCVSCINELMRIKGVGVKVANCVALFALGHREAFPVDVWIKRTMEKLYFEGKDTSKEYIEQFAGERFGIYGGYAQQYIFYYGRESYSKKK